MNQLSIFDLTPQPEPEPMESIVRHVVVENTSEGFKATDNPLVFDYQIPSGATDTTSILSSGDRVLIIDKKYSHGAYCPGIVAGFVANEILVRRRDGEGLYVRKELHKISNGENQ